jgi:hypothetical protein
LLRADEGEAQRGNVSVLDDPSYEDPGEVHDYAEGLGHSGDDLAGGNDDVTWKMAMDDEDVQVGTVRLGKITCQYERKPT